MSPKGFRNISHPELKILNSLVNWPHTHRNTDTHTWVNLELTTRGGSAKKYPSFPRQSSDLFQKRIWMVFTNSKIRNNSWDEKKSSLKVQKYIQDYKPQSGISVIPSTQNHVLKVLGFGHLSNKQQKTKYNYVFNNIEVIIFFSLSTSGLHLQDRNKFHHFNYAKHQMIGLR